MVFYSHHATNPTTVRATWELRTDAHVSGVDRNNVDYRHTSVASAAAGTNGATGAAILFVGKKTDKTLLGVGRLTDTDDSPGTSTTITSATKSVTFSVAALDCGVKYTNVPSANPNTSFFTDKNTPGPNSNPILPSDFNNVNAANTERINQFSFSDSTLKFPMFKLVESGAGGITHARYYFRTVGTTAGYYLSDFLGGIIQAGAGNYEKRQPRYPVQGANFQNFSVRLDRDTVITAGNNTTLGSPFQNPVEVKFDTAINSTLRGSMFAFVFEIPVCPLSVSPDAGRWYMRASYDSYWWDLDDGSTGGNGGAVLIGTGQIESFSNLRIRVIVPPIKWLYNGNTTGVAPNFGRDFNVEGLVVRLETKEGDLVRYLNLSELDFELGNNPIRVGQLVNSMLYGVNKIVVKYTDTASTTPYEDSFRIVCDDVTNPGRYTTIPSNHYYVVDGSKNDTTVASDLDNLFATAGTYVIVITRSIDFKHINMQDNRPLLVFIVASNPNLLVGRDSDTAGTNPGGGVTIGGGTGGGVFRSWSTGYAFYFGKWPFQSRIRIPDTAAGTVYTHPETTDGYTNPYTTYGYTLNAGGSGANTNDENYYARFIHYGQNNGRLYNVTVDESITLHNGSKLY